MTESLQTIARALVAPGKGILAADESNPTLEKRFDEHGIPHIAENRRAYHELLFTAPEIEKYLSGIILFDETIRQSTVDGIPFPALLTSRGIIPGIKVDQGTAPLDSGSGEMVTNGLDGLSERYKEYYALGARFAKWRAVFRIGDGLPSAACIERNAIDLATYAAVTQAAGLVPIVEPEVLMDGAHPIDRCYDVTHRVLSAVFDALRTHGVALDSMLLKPNMILPGEGHEKASPDTVAEATLRCLHETVPQDVPGIVFLSGGQTEQEACANLQAINAQGSQPWQLSFSYGRALQTSTLDAWKGNTDHMLDAQRAFLRRARFVAAARSGTYIAEMENT
ncbi:MAG TPA: class I fructose-bisphosphate aldolase [Candidatus Kapabacteria bacterium]|nr:class I fructose-bisphosphate aldolase [Candidatus Kapabacteria bacterium]